MTEATASVGLKPALPTLGVGGTILLVVGLLVVTAIQVHQHWDQMPAQQAIRDGMLSVFCSLVLVQVAMTLIPYVKLRRSGYKQVPKLLHPGMPEHEQRYATFFWGAVHLSKIWFITLAVLYGTSRFF